MNYIKNQIAKPAWLIFAAIFLICCSLRMVMATPDCSTAWFSCSECSIQGVGQTYETWQQAGESDCGTEGGGSSSTPLPITEANTECNPYQLRATAYGVDIGSLSPDCRVLSFTPHQGSVTVDPGETGCDSDVVNTDCGAFSVAIWGPKQPGQVTVTATVPYQSECNCGIISGTLKRVTVIEVQVPFSWLSPGPGGGGPGGGCGACASHQNSGASSAGTAGVGNDSVNFALNLGAANPRQYAGALRVYAETPSASLAQPALLDGPVIQPGVEVLTNGSGIIQQVLSPQMLVNVAVLNSYKYQLQCFYTNDVGPTNGSGLYTTNAPAFTTWTLENPDTTSATNRFWISELRDGIARYFKYTYTGASNRWDLLEPDNTTTISTWRIPDPSDSTITNYYRQVTTGSTVVQKTIMTYQYVTDLAKKVLLQEMDGDGATTNITTYTYYAGTNTDGSANRIQRVDYPNGNWVYYQYDSWGRKTNEFAAYGNSAPPSAGTVPDPAANHCKQTSYAYTLNSTDDGVDDSGDANDPWAIRRTIVSLPVNTGTGWELKEVSRTYSSSDWAAGTSETRECVNPGDHWDNANNLVTSRQNYPRQDWWYGMNELPYYIIHPNGTMTYYSYDDANTTTEYDPDGTQTVTITDDWGNPLSRTTTASGITLAEDTYNYKDGGGIYYDPLRRGHDVTDLGSRTTQYRYDDCCGYSTVTDPDGVLTRYDYDLLKRNVARTAFYGGANGIKTTNILDAVGQTLQTIRIGTNNTSLTLSQSQYDVLSRIVSQTNALNGVTKTAYVLISSQLYVTNTYPDGGTRIETYYRDGRLQSVTGTAVHPVEYLYGAEQDSDGTWREYTQEIKLTATGGTNEWTKTYVDGVGNSYKTLYSAATTPYPYSQSYCNKYGQLWKQVDPDGVMTLYVFNNNQGDFNEGQAQYTITALEDTTIAISDYASLVSSLSSIEGDGIDRVQMTTRSVVAADGMGMPNLVQNDTYVWLGNEYDYTSTLLSSSKTSTNGLETWNISYVDADISVTNHTEITPGTSRTQTLIAPDGSYIINAYSYGQLIASTRYDSAFAQIGGTTYNYDAHGRQYQVTDARNGTTIYGYNNADQVNSVATPSPGGGGSPETTTTLYDTMLRPYSVTQPDGTTVSTVYLLTGELGKQYGSRTYPVGYSYDYAGRMQTMTNWSIYSIPLGARVTTWNYDSQRGFLSSKVYDDNHGPSYTYTPAGRLLTRSWMRGVTTSYGYDLAGSLTNIVYSDSTPAVTNNYTRLGQLGSVICNGMTDALTYNLANELLTESFSGGTLNGLSVTNGYDQFLRRTNLTALASGILNQATYGYDNASRLATVSDGTNNATYSYLANSPLVSQIAFKQNSTTRMSTTKQYDYLNRLTQISSAPSGTGVPPVSFNYNYNAANQRTKNTLVDGSYWVYQYDSLGQVTSGKKYFYDGTLVPGQQFGYAFDDIGNRKQTQNGGDETGANLRTANYTYNTLNQTTNRDVPAYTEVLGVGLATNAVTVNSLSAYRKGEYFRKELPANNSATALWTNIIVAAAGQTSVTGNVFVAKAPEVFRYDADGNLTNDGRWAYTWDGENRLKGMTVNTNVGPQYQLAFGYDSKSRRIQKAVTTNGTAWTTNKFLYDGWNLVAELKPDNSPIRSYVWGTDLSGTIQGAGGVGGLLEISYYGSSTTNCFPAYDGNGNIMALVDAADGTLAANYDYAAFGEPIRTTGIIAKNNPFRFSTKYTDDESDLLYYGYRYYKPSTGTWLSRDPIGEKGGLNLYVFVKNYPSGLIDFYGMKPGGPLPPNVLPTPKQCCFKSSGNSPVNIPVGTSDSKADGFAGGVDMIAGFIKAAAENAIYNDFIAKGIAECAAQSKDKKGSCCGCCLIRLFLTVNKLNNDFTELHYNSATYYSERCGAVQYQAESQTGGDTLSPDYKTYTTQWFTGNKIALDWQFYDPQYTEYCP